MKSVEMIPVLLYHSISEDPGGTKKYTISRETFKGHLEHISHAGISCLTAEAMLVTGEKPVPHKCLLTFDDGRADNYHVVYPLLDKYALKATFFVITDLVGKSGYMSWDKIREMHGGGMSIQSHTASHCYLTSLDIKGIRDQLMRSKKVIEDRLSAEAPFLSLPFGDFNTKVIEECFRCGYRAVFTSKIGYAAPCETMIPRINIDHSFSTERVESILSAESGAIRMLRAKQNTKDLIKKIINYRSAGKAYKP